MDDCCRNGLYRHFHNGVVTHCGIRSFYAACCFNELSRGSLLVRKVISTMPQLDCRRPLRRCHRRCHHHRRRRRHRHPSPSSTPLAIVTIIISRRAVAHHSVAIVVVLARRHRRCCCHHHQLRCPSRRCHRCCHRHCHRRRHPLPSSSLLYPVTTSPVAPSISTFASRCPIHHLCRSC